MWKMAICMFLFGVCLLWSTVGLAEGFPVVVSVSDYKINPEKYDEISDPDVYFEIIHNASVIETSDTIRDNNFHSFGEMKRFGKHCQGISELLTEDEITIKFYDSDYDTNLVKQFWEWAQGSLYKHVVYFSRQVELMNDSSKKYDDYDAYKATTEDPELKKIENNLTDNIMAINNRRNNKREIEYMGEVVINVKWVTDEFQAGSLQHASDYEIANPSTKESIGRINLVIKRFEGYAAKYNVKVY
jgi:hypothetical protein